MAKRPRRPPGIKRSVILDHGENDEVNAIAVAERRSFNSVVRQAIAEFLTRRLGRRAPGTDDEEAA